MCFGHSKAFKNYKIIVMKEIDRWNGDDTE